MTRERTLRIVSLLLTICALACLCAAWNSSYHLATFAHNPSPLSNEYIVSQVERALAFLTIAMVCVAVNIVTVVVAWVRAFRRR
ncbi:hypothetical protein KRX51_10105 [Corynebacterium sp. TAE3-ERU12]|uniref:hypothetical protein n=1 Tax=Corynebacterium sp. TAE3-ERU12 TaxID=2849491 RepID=UPI001C466604|nr:hypothetical protein [Corynebacterium sp. TAE3-ERU12]MBV7296264.1 hypothetical protein [Corynebacterium sp. TAE3-ERU12]